MLFEFSHSSGAMVLKLEGKCTVEYAKELKAALLEGLDKSDTVLVDFAGVTEVDISCLQLLCSALGPSAERGKSVSIGADVPEQFRRLATDAGYLRALGFEDAEGNRTREGRK